MTLMVKKRSGKLEEFMPEKINKVLEWACTGLDGVSPSDIAMYSKMTIINKMTTADIQRVVIQSAVNLITENAPNYQYAAARLAIYGLRKEVWGESDPPRLYDHLRKNKRNYDPIILESYDESEIHKINKFIRHERDYLYTHAGIQQMIDKYLLCDRSTGEIFETPQFVFILVPMILFRNYEDRLEKIKTMYNYLSLFKINLPTPVLAGVRTTLKYYSSCVLADCGDSLESIFTTAQIIGTYTARRSGIGINMGRVRAIGSPIRKSEVISTGIIPYLKIMESSVKATSQNGLRGGGATVSFPWWHYESEDILVLKNNRGTDDNRVRKLDYCIQLEQLFFNRVVNNEEITLFCPNEVKGLYDAFGTSEFKELYEKYEADKNIKLKKKIPARELMGLIAKERLETGRIYVMFIDRCNQDSPWGDKVNMTNLCVAPETKVLIKGRGEVCCRDIDLWYNNEIEVWNGKQWSLATFAKTGENQQLLNIKFSIINESYSEVNQTSLRCTPYHKFYIGRGEVETKAIDLKIGDRIYCKYFDDSIRVAIVYDIKDGGIDDTYCVNEPLEHKVVFNGVLTGNCVEIAQPTIPAKSVDDPIAEIGVCILSAINLLEVKEDELEDVCRYIVYSLNELIDYQLYPFEAARKFCQNKRSLGVGVTNFAAYLAFKKLNHESPEAVKVMNDLCESIQYHLLSASCEMAEQYGPANDYANHSNYAAGYLPSKKEVREDLNFPLTMDWNVLQKRIEAYGLKNLTVTAQMPCESCLKWDTKVITSNGLLNFHEICESGDIDWQDIENNNMIGWHKLKTPISIKDTNINDIYYNGLAETYSIELADGSTVECTGSHKFLTTSGWKLASKLTEEDEILEEN